MPTAELLQAMESHAGKITLIGGGYKAGEGLIPTKKTALAWAETLTLVVG
ncbi:MULTISPECIES: hypothetical protein [unclassified Erwinia]|nr:MULTISPECIES: hypothetical protein [unclassified Erwinia]